MTTRGCKNNVWLALGSCVIYLPVHLKLTPDRELSGDTLAALQQFYDEREKSDQKFADLKQAAERQSANSGPLSMDMFTEDWNASQFWV